MKFFKMLNLKDEHLPRFKKKLLKAFLLLVLVVVVVKFVLAIGSYTSARYACHTRWVESDLDYKYTLRGGCLVKTEDGFIPADNYRVN